MAKPKESTSTDPKLATAKYLLALGQVEEAAELLGFVPYLDFYYPAIRWLGVKIEDKSAATNAVEKLAPTLDTQPALIGGKHRYQDIHWWVKIRVPGETDERTIKSK